VAGRRPGVPEARRLRPGRALPARLVPPRGGAAEGGVTAALTVARRLGLLAGSARWSFSPRSATATVTEMGKGPSASSPRSPA
jgi:hypothetical protein